MRRLVDRTVIKWKLPALAACGAMALSSTAFAQTAPDTSEEEMEPRWALIPLQPVDPTEFESTRLTDVITIDRESLDRVTRSGNGSLVPLISRPNAGSLLLSGEPRDDALCLRTGECETTDSLGFGISRNFTSEQADGLNFVVRPRAGVGFDGEGTSAVIGALVRIGDDLQEGGEIKSGSWYLFAGADAQALTYVPGSDGADDRLTRGWAVQDKIIVGDAQAGISYKLGEADISFAYIRREARFEEYKHKENAAAISLTWRPGSQ